MPISVSHKFIFIHIPKNAGSMISQTIKPYVQNRGRNVLLRRASANLPFKENVNLVCIRGHDSAAWVRTKIGAELFESYFKFTYVRNPYSRMISAYEFFRQSLIHKRNKQVLALSFEEFLHSRHINHLHQHPLICDRNEAPLVENILKHEELEQNFNPLFERLGIPAKYSKKLINSSVKRPKDEYLTPEAVEFIKAKFAKDFEFFDYSKHVDDI